MLFYEETTVITNQTILAQLIRYFGVERLLVLIEEELLSIVYTESNVGILTSTIGSTQYYSAVEFSSPKQTYQDELRKICISITGKDGKWRRLAQKIQDKIHVTRHDHIILEGANKSILDQNYVESAARIIVKDLIPDIGDASKISFRTEKTSNGIVVDTNIDFATLNGLYLKRVPPEHSSVTSGHILTHLLDVEKELYFAAANLAELSSSNLSAKLAEQKISYILARSAKSSESLTNFTRFLFNDAKAIREAVNSSRVDLFVALKTQ
jgi:hypothetical protein